MVRSDPIESDDLIATHAGMGSEIQRRVKPLWAREGEEGAEFIDRYRHFDVNPQIAAGLAEGGGCSRDRGRFGQDPRAGAASVGSLSWCGASDVGEDGKYAPVRVAVVGNVKFGEYVSDVCFDGAIADDEA